MSMKKPPRFPLFINLNKEKVLVVGGGLIAQRRVKVLLEFGADITLIAPSLTPSLEKLAQEKQIVYKERRYKRGDVQGARLVLAATNDRLVNKRIGEAANQAGVAVSVADAMTESSFYFPAIIQGKGVVVGMVSQGGDHHQVKKVAAELRKEWGQEDETEKY